MNAEDKKYSLKVSAKINKYMMTDKSQSDKKNSGGSGGIPPGKDVNSFLFLLFVPIIGMVQSSSILYINTLCPCVRACEIRRVEGRGSGYRGPTREGKKMYAGDGATRAD